MPESKKTKAVEPTTVYTLVDGEKSYDLPPLNGNAANIPARYTKDAIMRPEDQAAQFALGCAMLDSIDIPDETRAAIENLPTNRFVEVIGEWMGESRGSSAS